MLKNKHHLVTLQESILFRLNSKVFKNEKQITFIVFSFLILIMVRSRVKSTRLQILVII